MNKKDFPNLENFLSNYFTNDFDFDELLEALSIFKRFEAVGQYAGFAEEVQKLKSGAVQPAEFNAFSAKLGGRKYSKEKFERFISLLTEEI